MAATSYLAAAPVVRRVRGYFAAVNRVSGTPVLFDPAGMAAFGLNAPPAPWVSLGWISDFKRVGVSKSAAVLTGIPAGVLEQVRESVEAQSSFSLPELDEADDGAGEWFAAHECSGRGERRGG